MDIKLKIWRQKGPDQAGYFEDHRVKANPHMSFLEMLDVLNEQLLEKGKDPVAFDHDCREGICGACSMVIDGRPHGPRSSTTTCTSSFTTRLTCWKPSTSRRASVAPVVVFSTRRTEPFGPSIATTRTFAGRRRSAYRSTYRRGRDQVSHR